MDADVDAGGADSGVDAGPGIPDAGTCTGPADCRDDDPCTLDRCEMGVCENPPDDTCISQVEPGLFHTCARRGRGTELLCWGSDARGQLGNGAGGDSVSPAAVMTLTNPTQVSMGEGAVHTCALVATGGVFCWGANDSGQLGDGTQMDRQLPTEVMGLSNVAEISCGGLHSCARLTSGAIRCWGSNLFSQLGRVTVDPFDTAPGSAGPLLSAQISAGGAHTCARLGSGALECWGRNDEGQLGDGMNMTRTASAPVLDLMGTLSVQAGGLHTCAVLADRTVSCWGSNSDGQLGLDPAMTTATNTPTPVPGVSNVAQLACGGRHTCALLQDGSIQCWGQNSSGQLGDNTNFPSDTPVDVQGVTDAISIAAANMTTCARRVGGEVLCWGDNMQSQLAMDSSTPQSSVPVPIPL